MYYKMTIGHPGNVIIVLWKQKKPDYTSYVIIYDLITEEEI